MLEVTTMPAWANFAAIAAIILLCATAWGGKINSMSNITLTKANFKGVYYAFAALTTVLLAGFFFMQSPVEASATLIGINVGILFLAFLVCVFGGMDYSKREDLIDHIKLVLAVAIGCIIFVALLFANVGYAAIWMGIVATFGFLGHFLFPSAKTK